MLNTDKFGELLKSYGHDFYAGLPCPFLAPLMHYALNAGHYLIAANEGDAVAMCNGAYLAGKKPVFLCQNTGLTNATSPLIAMNHPLQIPLLGFISLRGEACMQDEPQHHLMGQITGALLTQLQIEWTCLSDDFNTAIKQMKVAEQILKTNKSYFFIVKQNTFQEVTLTVKTQSTDYDTTHIAQTHVGLLSKRNDVLKCLIDQRQPNTLLVATAGGTSQELAQLDHDGRYLSMVGGTGCVSSLALGLAMTNTDHNFIAIDGDGALLMRLGALTTNAFYHPPNLLHILLNNGIYESTGGQSTVAQSIDFSLLAAAVKTPRSIYAHNLMELKQIIHTWQNSPSFTFVHMHIAPGLTVSSQRPSPSPLENKQHFKKLMIQSTATQKPFLASTIA